MSVKINAGATRRQKRTTILPSDDAAAHHVVGVAGWVDRHGMFYGTGFDAEKRAREGGATHRVCKHCDAIIEKNYIVCQDCVAAREKEAYSNRPKAHWTGQCPVYSEAADEYFFTDEDLDDYIAEHNYSMEDMRLRLCDELVFPQLEEDFYYSCGDDPDVPLPASLVEAIKILNTTALYCKSNVWEPNKYAMVLPGQEET